MLSLPLFSLGSFDNSAGQQRTRLLMLPLPSVTEDPRSSPSLWLMAHDDWLGWVALLSLLHLAMGQNSAK